eukprot:1142312-Pelagomonas_calceolata.AAC.2
MREDEQISLEEPSESTKGQEQVSTVTVTLYLPNWHNIASRILLKAISKGPLGAGHASMDIGSTDCLTMQSLQIPKLSTI